MKRSSIDGYIPASTWLMMAYLIITPAFTTAHGQAVESSGAHPAYEFRNGRWFDGNGFVERTFYTEYGTLSAVRPVQVDSVIDLAGAWVVPPYGEAHNHNIEPSGGLDALIDRYLEGGVYYVKNPNVLPSAVIGVREQVNQPMSVDVSFAFGGFTGPGGHPIGVVDRNIERGIWSEEEGEGAFFYEIADPQDLERKWAGFLAHDPDFVNLICSIRKNMTVGRRIPRTSAGVV